MLVLLKNHLNYLQYRNFEWFLRSIIDFFFWAGKNFPSEKDDLKKFDKNNTKIALNILHAKKRKNVPCLYFEI